MKKMRMLFMAAGLVFLFSVVFPVLANAQSAKEYIPKATVNADIMTLVSSSRLQELLAKIKAGTSKDPQWYMEYVSAARPGAALAYHPKLGVSEAEYNEFLELSKTGNRMVKSGESTIDFRWITDSVVQIVAGGALADLNGIEIDLISNRVKTSFGTLSILSEVNNTDPNSPTGSWRGVQWKLGGLAAYSGVVAKLALGRLTNTGKGILYFSAKEIRPDGTLRRADNILFYDL